ncbi:glycoside hydrolase family 16 protein [Nocardioides sp.]|uniref:glycoside hydrolase family 16 protein n=1 Tax=Nocardioides sp. TaxID=35761 RepID=UPI002C76AE6A|nr:glycoside hydrolase family 16 protein [Nocardioides sp.]HXH80376.1 glycoside hydrolase family 16 protein [Nocardioides sp.]
MSARFLRTGLFLGLAVALALPMAPAQAEKAEQSKRKPNETTVVRGGTLVALPPVVQPGTSPAAPSNAGQVVATFDPARIGRTVLLERKTGGDWRQVARKRQDAWGSAAFATQPGTYRARTETDKGHELVTGTVVSRAWAPTFEDTFSDAAVSSSIWGDQRREHESVYAARTCARTDAAAHRVESGVMHLGLALDPERLDQRCQYTTDTGAGEQSFLLTSQVATENTYAFSHGIAAARMKPQQAKGMHSGFWMLPEGSKFTDGNAAAGTEIDVMEFFGETPGGRETIGSFVYYYEAGWVSMKHGGLFKDARQSLSDGASWWDEFHVFSVEWTPEAYIFRVDGREYYRETNAVSQARQYLVLSMLASDYELADLTADEIGQTAQVDWVRVWDGTSVASRKAARRG